MLKFSIKNRRPLNYKQNKSKTKSRTQTRTLTRNGERDNSIQNKVFVRTIKTSFKPKRIKDRGILKEKKLICDNLLLGKRLLQTPHSFGNTFRHTSTESKNSSKLRTTGFSRSLWMQRSIKLNDFKSLEPQFKYIRGSGKHILKLVIKNLQYQSLKYKLIQSVNISITAQIGKHKKSSQLISIHNFIGHQFNLRFGRNLHGKQIKIIIRYHNGNSDLQMGQFQFRIPRKESEIKQNTTYLNRSSGVLAGLVTYKGQICKAIHDYDKI